MKQFDVSCNKIYILVLFDFFTAPGSVVSRFLGPFKVFFLVCGFHTRHSHWKLKDGQKVEPRPQNTYVIFNDDVAAEDITTLRINPT